MSNTHNNLWQAVKELEFLSAFFSWLFMLLTRLAEPLMLIATLYVVAETGVPVVASPVAHDLAIGVMITAPEVLLPGAFVVAAKAQEQQRRQARLLFVVCWLFVGLTLATLFDLFLLHLSGPGLAALMFARCAVAVAYSILMRVMSHGAKVAGMSTVFAPTVSDIPALVAQVIRDAFREHTARIPAVQKPAIPCEHYGVFPVSAYAPLVFGAAYAGFTFTEFTAVSERPSERVSEPQSEREPVTDVLPTVNIPVNTGGNKKRSLSKTNDLAAQRVRRVIKRSPDATIDEIMEKAGVSRGYASRIRSQVRSEQEQPA